MSRHLNSKAKVLSAMILREPYQKFQKLHPKTIERLVRTTQTPQPLKYKVSPDPVDIKLPHAPPLGLREQLPFFIERSNSGNLPVYVTYRNQRTIKRTVIRKISGDVDEFVKELTKVVSNNDVNKKVGRVEIPGIHRESVNTWLLKLGF